MTAEQHQRVREIFEAALDRDLSERASWVARQAADDPAVLGEVISLRFLRKLARRSLTELRNGATER